MSGLKSLKKGEILFREGDASDAMYVIKSGKISITKAKGSSEIILAELGPGDMLGEMAFFDNKPRSAGAKASVDAVVIVLPFKALNAQFKTFPEWIKAVVRSVNTHLRNANQKIKNFEKSAEEETEYFSPHMVVKLTGVLGLVGARYGTRTEGGAVEVPAGTLRRYTIQVYQLPTAKMTKLMEMLQSFNMMKIEDLGEGRQRLTVFDLDFIVKFTDYYTEWLFTPDEKRVMILEKEVKPLKALVHYGKKETPNAKGDVKVNLTQVQANCEGELGFPFSVDEVCGFEERALTSERMAGEAGLQLSFNLASLQSLAPYWELIYAFKRVQREA